MATDIRRPTEYQASVDFVVPKKRESMQDVSKENVRAIEVCCVVHNRRQGNQFKTVVKATVLAVRVCYVVPNFLRFAFEKQIYVV